MKRKSLKIFAAIGLCMAVLSCEPKLQPIEFGQDQCSFCVMNIVDRTHAAQYVTSKGKQFKFDAIECMVNDVLKKGEAGIAIMQVADFAAPGRMTSARDATYIICEAIKSPMGANLSAVAREVAADSIVGLHGGKCYTWNEIKEQIRN